MNMRRIDIFFNIFNSLLEVPRSNIIRLFLSNIIFWWGRVNFMVNRQLDDLFKDINGQTKSIWFFQANISSKKRTKEFDFTTMIPQVDLFSFVFWRKSMTPKNHFEINWPLPIMEMLKNLSMISTQNTFYLISFHIRCHKSKILLFIAVDWFENSYIP